MDTDPLKPLELDGRFVVESTSESIVREYLSRKVITKLSENLSNRTFIFGDIWATGKI